MREPMRKGRGGETDMDLPEGKTCQDCRHFDRCNLIYGHIAADEVCDWSPSRYQQLFADQKKRRGKGK